jgi:DNA-binding response OmpR family regulator
VKQAESRRLHVALVEDEATQRLLVARMLEASGFRVSAFADTVALRRDSALQNADLILLDWELPNESGLDLLRSIREAGTQTPVIFLTAVEDEGRVVHALEFGADDYQLKPPKMAELSARIRAVVRRSTQGAGSGPGAGPVHCAPYTLDRSLNQLRLHDRVVPLTAREFELALHFFQHVGQSVGRDMLMIRVWRTNPNVTTRSIDTFVSRLRKKLGLDGTHGWKLEAVYQRGYRLVAVDMASEASVDTEFASV